MQDVIFVVVMVAFFALCVLLVRACDWVIGSDELAMAGSDPSPDETDQPDHDDEKVAA